MEVRLSLTVKCPIQGLSCAIRIRSNQDVWLTTSTIPQPLDVKPGLLELRCVLKNILRTGVFALDVEVEEHGAIPILKCNQVMSFEVFSSIVVHKSCSWHGGIFVIEGTWSKSGDALY
jgi:hypothetical protein